MRKIGEVREIWRYPVSSLRGERLETASLVATGVDGDRIVGLFDADTLTVANPDSEKRWRVAPQTRGPRRDVKYQMAAAMRMTSRMIVAIMELSS